MTNPPGDGSAPPPAMDAEQQFTVPVPSAPVPRPSEPTQSIPRAPTERIPAVESGAPMAEGVRAAPAPATWPVPPPTPGETPAYAASTPPWAATTAGPQTALTGLVPLGRALVWIAVGWWLFFLVRLATYAADTGFTSTMVYEMVDVYGSETVVAASVSVAGAVALSLGRAERSKALWVFSIALAVATVAITVWRFVP